MLERLTRIVDARPGEWQALWCAFAFHFLVLASYYVLRPIRDEIGAAGGLESLSWLFTATLVAMLAANVLFSAIAARLSRRRFIPLAYRFFIGTLVVFYLLMQVEPAGIVSWVGQAFYVWVSVFNLFVVSVFWAFMADVFAPSQGKRLFGFIAVGGTLGAILGGTLTAALVEPLGSAGLLVLSALLLEGAAWCVRVFPRPDRVIPDGGVIPRPEGPRDLVHNEIPRFARDDTFVRSDTSVRDDRPEWPLGGTFWSGIAHVFKSPYLLGICGFMLLHSVTSTLVYFQQADIAGQAFADRGARTAFFAQLDIAVNVLTVLMQVFLTGRLLKWLGVGLTLGLLPLVSLGGFAAMAVAPSLALLAAFQIARRAVNYAVSRPAREVLFTVLPREDKYKAKAFTDTFVYRAGDQVGAWSYPLLRLAGLGLAGVSAVAVPLTALWCALSVWLGRRQAEACHPEGRSPEGSAGPSRSLASLGMTPGTGRGGTGRGDTGLAMDFISLVIHVAAGSLAIVAGYIAIFAAKGSELHRRSGMAFVYAMIVMGMGAVAVGALRGEQGLLGGPMAAYFVITALTTVRPVGRRIDIAMMASVLAISALSYLAVLQGHTSVGGAPPGMIAVFATITLLAGLGDIRALVSPPQGARRIARHLWRMCFGFFFATGSFFFGQMDEFPIWLQKPALMAIPATAPLVLMGYWLWRVRVRRRLSGLALRTELTAAASSPR